MEPPKPHLIIRIIIWIWESTRSFMWNRKYRKELEEIREALLKSDFNNGSDVEWDCGCHTWGMELKDIEGKRYIVTPGWKAGVRNLPLKIYVREEDYDGTLSKFHEIDLNILLTGSKEEINEHVQFIKGGLWKETEIEAYVKEKVGKMILVREGYGKDREGKAIKIKEFTLGGYVEGWPEDKESFNGDFQVLDTAGYPRGFLLNTKENKNELTTIITGFGEGEYRVRKFEEGKEESRGKDVRVVQGVEIERVV